MSWHKVQDYFYNEELCTLEIAKELVEKGLKENFEDVFVELTKSPDISQPPFNMTNKGFGKNMFIAEIGGPGNLYPHINKDHTWNLKDVVEQCEVPNAGLFGPGAGPWEVIGTNCEMVADANFTTNVVKTRIAKLEDNEKGYKQLEINDPHFSLMANLAVFDADEPGDVIHFKVKKRTGEHNLPECIRQALFAKYNQTIVSMAGLFIMHEGEAKLHVMPDFPGCDFENKPAINEWLKFFTMKAPLVCSTVIHTNDGGGLHLRLEHTHCFSDHGDAGHYHYDTTPETVVYEGWMALSEKIRRFDKCEDRKKFTDDIDPHTTQYLD